MEKQNVAWKKNFSIEKKMSVAEFPLAKTDMFGMSGTEFPVMQDRKTAEAGEKRPRAFRGKRKVQLVKKNVGWKKNASGPE